MVSRWLSVRRRLIKWTGKVRMRQRKTLIEGTWLNNVAYIFVVQRAWVWSNNVTAPIKFLLVPPVVQMELQMTGPQNSTQLQVATEPWIWSNCSVHLVQSGRVPLKVSSSRDRETICQKVTGLKTLCQWRQTRHSQEFEWCTDALGVKRQRRHAIMLTGTKITLCSIYKHRVFSSISTCHVT